MIVRSIVHIGNIKERTRTIITVMQYVCVIREGNKYKQFMLEFPPLWKAKETGL
jgi:hypothetical protein